MNESEQNNGPDGRDGIADNSTFKAGQQAAVHMQRCAESLMSSGCYDSAVTLLCGSLMVQPARVPAIHQIGKCLDALGEKEQAQSCYRGTLPDSLNEKYFNAKTIEEKVLSVAACADVTYLPGFDEERIKLNPPVRNCVDKNYTEFGYKETHARAAFCTVAEEGSVWFDRVNVVALDKKANVIKEHIKGSVFTSYNAIQTTDPHVLEGTACFLDGRSSSIYYHWMLDILPKIGVMQSSGIKLDDIDHFIVSAKSKFQIATLRACGIREEQLLFLEESCLYQANKMVIPSLKNDQGERIYHGLGVGIGSNVLAYLREVFGANQSKQGQSKQGQSEQEGEDRESVRVYISRSTRGSRNVANEPELIEALKERGFETIEFEGLTVPEQAELMSRAEMVVGVHGAGFTNVSFCKPGTRVVEIFGDYVVPCYWALCGVAQLEYAQFMASSVAAAESADNPGARVAQLRDMEIEVDVKEFIDFLDKSVDTTIDSAIEPGNKAA